MLGLAGQVVDGVLPEGPTVLFCFKVTNLAMLHSETQKSEQGLALCAADISLRVQA